MASLSEIFGDAIRYPFNDYKKFLIFGVLSIIGSLMAIVSSLGINSGSSLFILAIVSLICYFIMGGYAISIIRETVNYNDVIPSLDLGNNIFDGIKSWIVSFIYFIIPAIIVGIVAACTGFFNACFDYFNAMQNSSVTMFNDTVGNVTVMSSNFSTAFNTVPQDVMISLVQSMFITFIVAIILFIIFGFLESVGICRLSKYGSIVEAVKINEVAKDLRKIGILSFIGFYIVLLIISIIIGGVFSLICGFISSFAPVIGIILISLILTPFITMFGSRALGLIYNNIEE